MRPIRAASADKSDRLRAMSMLVASTKCRRQAPTCLSVLGKVVNALRPVVEELCHALWQLPFPQKFRANS